MCFSLAALTCFLLPLSAVHFRKGNSTIHNVSHEITVPSGLLLSWEKLALHKLCNNSVFLSQMAHFFQNSKACCIYLAMLISLGCIHFILLCKFKETLNCFQWEESSGTWQASAFLFPLMGSSSYVSQTGQISTQLEMTEKEAEVHHTLMKETFPSQLSSVSSGLWGHTKELHKLY